MVVVVFRDGVWAGCAQGFRRGTGFGVLVVVADQRYARTLCMDVSLLVGFITSIINPIITFYIQSLKYIY
jgi:hypothetical protein